MGVWGEEEEQEEEEEEKGVQNCKFLITTPKVPAAAAVFRTMRKLEHDLQPQSRARTHALC